MKNPYLLLLEKCLLPAFLILLFSGITPLFAQFKVQGIVQDSKNKAPIAFASILLQSIQDSSDRKGVSSLMDGQFMLNIQNPGPYQLIIQMVGYQEYKMDSLYILKSQSLAPILMHRDTQNLDEIIIRADRSRVENRLGKKILHIGEDLANAGQSLAEVLDNLPAVDINPEGEINLRGSQNVIIYVNGQETRRKARSLQNIPADAIEKVELITSPSAQYDAEGVAGIINIVYQRQKVRDFKLAPQLSFTLPTRVAVGLNSSLRAKNLDIYANYNFRFADYERWDDQNRLNPEDELEAYFSRVNFDGDELFHNLDAGLSWEPDTSLSLNLELNYLRWDDQEPNEQINRFVYRNSPTQELRLQNDHNELEDEIFLTLSFLKKFQKQKRLNLQFSAGGEDENNQEFYNLEALDLSNSPLFQSIQSSIVSENQRYYRAKWDLRLPFRKGFKLETGGQSNLTIFKILQDLEFVDPRLEDQSSDFRVRQWKQAFYIQMGQEIGGFSYLVGSRMEYFHSEAEQKSLDSNFNQRYLRFFPSLQLSYQAPSQNHSLGFSYSRRINPPGFFDLNPFIFYQDPLNLSSGNPFLEPAFAHIYELSYNGLYGNLSLDLTIFRRDESNSIQEVVSNLDEERTLQTSRNFARKRNEGLEIRLDYPIGEWLKLSANSSVYRTFFQEDASENIRLNDQWTWAQQIRQLFKIPGEWQIEISQNYRSPRIGPQVRFLARNYINLSIRKSFMKKRGLIALNFQDIFNKNEFSGEWSGDGFEINYRNKYQTQRMTLSLRFKIWD